MTVISSVSFVPSRLIAMLDVLLADPGPRERASLLALIAPPSLRGLEGPEDEDGNYGRELVREASDLGLVEIDGTRVSLTDEGRAAAASPREWLRRQLTDPERAVTSKQGDFPTVLVWLLTQDPLIGLDFQKNFSAEIESVFKRDLGMSNFSKSQQFFHWARYLGFAWWTRAERPIQVMPDPTAALQGMLAHGSLPRGSSIPVRSFVQWMGEVCPVLEGGVVRTSLAGDLPPAVLGGFEVGHFSASTGIALERLSADGILKLERLSDAELLVAGPPEMTSRPISHITIARAAR